MKSRPQVPPTAVRVQVADLTASGTLLFFDAEGRVVYGCACAFQPVFHPHSLGLQAQIERVEATALAELSTGLPAVEPTGEVNYGEGAGDGKSDDEERGGEGSPEGHGHGEAG